MANIKSQIKRNRQNEKRRLRNRVVRGSTRAVVKNTKIAIEAGNAETAKAALAQAISALDKAAEKGVLHKNNVARRKSRLMKKFAALPATPAVEPQPAAAVAEPEPTTPKKAATRKRAAAPKPAEEPVVETVAVEEPASKAKKPATKKPAAKKPAAAKPAAKKTAARKNSTKAAPKDKKE